ncbi:hypothetical protein AAF712_000528 [Marasmius tenuissimus]|uniref:O-fucosyltransferase family protein n=1 Tax=Marasmius tenuissimus TaxID=585030 RepID=A0ABR3AFQ4_9AGAR
MVPHNKRGQIRPTSSQNNTYVTILLLLLASGCAVSFGLAYYLFTTRWANPNQPSHSSLADNQTQVVHVESPQVSCPTTTPGEKFLVYHPHSGFHNQRISLENALTLSHLLNRTLIIPPIRLGKPISYGNFNSLHYYLSISDKVGLRHCAGTSPESFLPPECFGYFDYTYIPWNWLLDFRHLATRHRFVFRGNHTDEWLSECLGISESDVSVLEEFSRYHYQFLDKPTKGDDSGPSDKYDELVFIAELEASREPLLYLGTLFGTSRLLLSNKENARIRRRIREDMAFKNPLLVNVSNSIVQSLGGMFIGVHIRVGDGPFVSSGRENARSVWWTLVHQTLNLSVDETMSLQSSVLPHANTSVPIFAPYSFSPVPPQFTLPPSLRCRRPLHTRPSLTPLNTPLYLATDAPDPRNHRSLALFFETFPCIFTLTDFYDQLGPLDYVVNDYDGLTLKPFLLSFVDAMVLGHARTAVGTTSSTYSAFALDVLWPTYHGMEIRERIS